MKIAKKVVSIILWVFAVVFLVYAVWSFVLGTSIVKSALDAGQVTVKDNFFDIYNYYMTAPGSSGYSLNGLYFAVGLLMVGTGFALWPHKKCHKAAAEAAPIAGGEDKEEDEKAAEQYWGMPVAENIPASDETVAAETAEEQPAEAEAAAEEKAAEAQGEVKAEADAVTQE